MKKIFEYKGFEFKITVAMNNRLSNDKKNWIHDVNCASISIPEKYKSQKLKYENACGAFDGELMQYITNCENYANKWVDENIIPDYDLKLIDKLKEIGFEDGE